LKKALANFNDTLLYLRGNTYIDYEQLGLKFKLYSCEVLFNRGLCYIYLQQESIGMQDFQYAVKEKMALEHDVIDRAIREPAEVYTVFSMPVGVLYRPHEAKVKNLKIRDHSGKARLIATTTSNIGTSLAGAEDKENQTPESSAKDDRLAGDISYAAIGVVPRDLAARGVREQRTPFTTRTDVFAPTPPPEYCDPSPTTHEMSLALSSPDGKACFTQLEPRRQHTVPNQILRHMTPPRSVGFRAFMPEEGPRLGTTRTASKPRGPQSRQKQTYENVTQSGRFPLYGEVVSDMQCWSKQQRSGYRDQKGRCSNAIPPSLRNHRRSHSTKPSTSLQSSFARPEMRRIRITVHKNEDTRYIMMKTASVVFVDFEGEVRGKFDIKGKMRIFVQDWDSESNQQITIADQDDVDVLLDHVKSTAWKDRSELGKMEVWVQQMV